MGARRAQRPRGLVLLTDAFAVGGTSLVWVVITTLVVVVGVAVALRGGFDRDPAEVLARGSSRSPTGVWAPTRPTVRLVAAPVLALARCRRLPRHRGRRRLRARHGVATRAAGWAGARAHRGERPGSAVGLVLAAVVVLGLAGVLAWS